MAPALIDSKYVGYDILWTGLGVTLGGIVLLLIIVWIIHAAKLYKLLPGWGPIVRFDADTSDELRYRQEVFKHSREQAGFERPAEGVWRKQPGEYIQHPVYGTVRIHPNQQALYAERASDPYAPRDEQHDGGRHAAVKCHASRAPTRMKRHKWILAV
ncbi:unnamed protein product [Amoebophrya sp. A25]|nr:unnamed protein product [Amoebophrya sp. A25]|eukprot:GSA25T00000686001.1